MNILLYVLTMLMLLASLTYIKIEAFRTFASLEAGFAHYMTKIERAFINESAEVSYKKTIVSQGNSNRQLPNPFSSRLSFRMFIDADLRSKHPEEYKQTRELAKQLMSVIFEGQPFFKDLSESRPEFLYEILDEIVRASEEQLKEDRKLRNAEGITKLEFADKELHYALYLMFHGIPTAHVEKEEEEEKLEFSQDKKEDKDGETTDAEEEKIEADESEESPKQIGKISLLDYITIKPSLKVRVYLAAKPLLMAIYDNESIVDSIIERRQEAYSEVKKTKQPASATQTFQNAFATSGNAQNFAAILDFGVTNVDPKAFNKGKN